MRLKAIATKTKPLPERAADQIIDLIVQHQLQPGDKLPNEFAMAQQLQVGRGTIREAMKILVSRNIVEVKRGNGTFVCQRPGMVEDPLGLAFVQDKSQLAMDLWEIRYALEPEIAALAAKRATDEEIVQLQQLCDEVEALCRARAPHMAKDIQFHEHIARCSHNQVVPNIIPVIQSAVALFITVTESSLLDETIRTHRAIVESIKARDAEGARAAMTQHMVDNQAGIQSAAARQAGI